MGKVAQLNGDEYHESFYNPHPYPGWCPELKHIKRGFIKELKEKKAAGVATKVDLETLSELFDIIIRLSNMLLKDNEFKQKTKVFVKAVNAFNYKLLIDDIVQQGRIEVNEAGTEAAMATYCVMFTGCPPHEKPKPIEMKVNHEFIFEVVEAYTGIRLFSGFVNKL